MKIVLFFLFFVPLCTLNAQIKATLTFKDSNCKQADCECYECFYKFTDEQGKELIFNQIKVDKIPDFFIEREGQKTINADLVDKRFIVEYKEGVCVCLKNEKSGSFMEESSSKCIVSISLMK
jgi:hypothetical protein